MVIKDVHFTLRDVKASGGSVKIGTVGICVRFGREGERRAVVKALRLRLTVGQPVAGSSDLIGSGGDFIAPSPVKHAAETPGRLFLRRFWLGGVLNFLIPVVVGGVVGKIDRKAVVVFISFVSEIGVVKSVL